MATEALQQQSKLTGLIAQPTQGSLPPSKRANSAYYPWMVWAVSVTFVLFQFFIQLSAGEIIGGLMHSFKLSALGGGLLASAYYYVYVTLQTPAGMLMDWFGPRRLLTAGALVTAVGGLLFAITSHIWLALIGRLMMGAGSAFAFVGTLYLIAQWFPIERFVVMVSLSETFGMLGNIVGGIVFATLILHFGWRLCMVGAAAIAFSIGISLWLIVRDSPHNVISITSQTRQQFWSDLKKLIAQPMLWVNGIYGSLIFSLATVFLALWGIPFLQHAHHVTLVTATTIDDMAFVGIALGCPLLGYLDNRFPEYRRKILMAAGIVAALLLSLVIYLPGLPTSLLVLIMIILGVATSSYVLTLAIANEIASPSVRATSIGFTNMLTMVSAPLLQPLVGIIVKLTSSTGHQTAGYSVSHYEVAMGFLPVLLLAAAYLARYLPQRHSN